MKMSNWTKKIMAYADGQLDGHLLKEFKTQFHQILRQRIFMSLFSAMMLSKIRCNNLRLVLKNINSKIKVSMKNKIKPKKPIK